MSAESRKEPLESALDDCPRCGGDPDGVCLHLIPLESALERLGAYRREMAAEWLDFWEIAPMGCIPTVYEMNEWAKLRTHYRMGIGRG